MVAAFQYASILHHRTPADISRRVFRFLARHFDQIQIKSSFHWQL